MRDHSYRIFLATFWICLALALPGRAQTTARCTEVIDGDSLVLDLDNRVVTVDLDGIDAPEIDQLHGPAARDALEKLVKGQQLTVWMRPGDVPVARIEADGKDLGLELLGVGLAWIGDTEDESYALAAIRARSEKKGLWAERHPVPPWSWRNRRPVPTPVPTHPPTIRKLSEMAMRTELEKNKEGRTVIEGLPQKKPANEQKKAAEPEAEEGYHLDFSCSEDVLADCVELQFVSSFEEASGGNAGTFKRQESRSDGEERSFVFEGDGYSVPVSCRCPQGEACSCSIDIQKTGATEAAEEESTTVEPEKTSDEADKAAGAA